MTSVGGRPHAEANALKGLKFEKEKLHFIQHLNLVVIRVEMNLVFQRF